MTPLARSSVPWILAAAGLLWSAQSALDPFRPAGSFFGPLLAAVALGLERRRPFSARRLQAYAVALALAAAYGISAQVLIEFRADSSSYFAYLRSPAFDGDFDFRNEWDHFAGGERDPSVAGRTLNVFSAGPALLWSPFFGIAHAYVRLDHFLGSDLYPIDGLSLPYLRATLLGTITVVVIGAGLLVSAIARAAGTSVALLAVAGAFLASPVLYYTFFAPAMSHGVAAGVAAAFLWSWDRAREKPSLRAWLVLGSLLGVLAMCRWQASLYALLLLPLAASGVRRKTVRIGWLIASAGAALVAFAPQAMVWKIGFGEWILLPQGRGFFDLSSPHWLDTLVSANHGFFNWTPVMLLGSLGLLAGLRSSPLLCGGGVLVFIATAWVNGSVPAHDWAGGDAFGARRYSFVVPIVAVGLSQLLPLTVRWIRKAPLVVPAAVLAMACLWNLGFISHFRARRYPEAAPLERLARDQARSLRTSAQEVFGLVAGDRGQALAYQIFSAEYFYGEFNRSGTILLRGADERYLLSGWGTPSRRIARRTFRRALYPEACVRIPLKEPFRLRVTVSARAPDGLESQSMTVAANGRALTTSRLPPEWLDVEVEIPEDALVSGENALCLRFTSSLREEEGEAVAALVERIQLP